MMDERIQKASSLANAAAYDSDSTERYIAGAPHLKHARLSRLYRELVVSVYDAAKFHTHMPRVLDLGAGEGSATLPFLELGAKVTAVDISENQLKALHGRCAPYADRLEVRCQDIFDALQSFHREGREFEIVVTNSFLHHVPDYLSFACQATTILPSGGQFFSFQDPLRYDSIGVFARTFCTVAYLSWRLFRGDIIGGLGRRIRRMRGVYLEDCLEDNVEYHAVRGGVDQDEIQALFRNLGFDCAVVRYFSTQSPLWQPIGTALGIENTFAVVAKRRG